MKSPFTVDNRLDSKRVPNVRVRISNLGRLLEAKLNLNSIICIGYHKSNVDCNVAEGYATYLDVVGFRDLPDSFDRKRQMSGCREHSYITKLEIRLLVHEEHQGLSYEDGLPCGLEAMGHLYGAADFAKPESDPRGLQLCSQAGHGEHAS